VKLQIIAVGVLLVAGALFVRQQRHDAADEVRQEYAAAATRAALAALKKQERLQDAVNQVGERHEKTKRANAASAAAASDELDGLRNELAARDAAATEAPAAACGVDAGRAERELLGLCATTLIGLAKEADRLEGKLGALQDYVRQIRD
jgi:Flp pilus assembly protein TadB